MDSLHGAALSCPTFLAQPLAESQRAEGHDDDAEGGQRQHLRPQHGEPVALQEDAADDGQEVAQRDERR